jgi:sugar (pentulose or hexulose) kinase
MYLTFDVGTTSVKTALYSREGKLVSKAIESYRLNTPAVGWYEVEPEVYWSSVVKGFRQIMAESGTAPGDIKSVSGCSQGETVIFLDREDRAVRPAMVWYDNRAVKEVEELKKVTDNDEFYRITGILEIATLWSALKIMWVKNNEKDVFKKISRIMLVEDYITYRLTGRFVSSASLLSTSALIDIHKREYWGKTVDYLGIRDILPEIVEEGSIVGKVLPDIAEEIGIKKGTAVIKGSMDQNTGAVGAGNINPGIIAETTGSALAITITSDDPQFSRETALPYQPHAIPGKYIILPFAEASGIVYTWFKDEIVNRGSFGSAGSAVTYDDLNKMASTLPPGADGLVFLPFLTGATFPENDSHAKGVFYGLTLKHTTAHMARAILESIGFMLKKILTYVEEAGIQVKEIRSMGGGARSEQWLQIKSDICGYPLIRMEEEEAPTLGAALLASVKVGDYSSLEEAVRAIVKTGKKFIPDIRNAEQYSKSYALYNELYRALKPLFRKHD